MSDTKNDVEWEKLFDKYQIVNRIKNDGFFVIKSSQINEFREARLMTKFDYKSQLPKLYKENKFSILPISRGSYIISNIETFKSFEKNDIQIQKVDFPNYIESINFNNITSESSAINCAFVSGIIEDFTNEQELKPTVNGRMGSGKFDFNIKKSNTENLKINVANSQIEIDGGFEGVNYLSLIEAKNSISDDFLIRQLYYPFKLWENKLKKPVKNIFLTYTNGIFHLREYVFENPNHYNSLLLVKEKKYVIRDNAINLEVINTILKKIKIIDEPSVPFPQADSFERVINLCELLYENNSLAKEQITEKYDFDSRQTNYYTDAGRYLGLIEKSRVDNNIMFSLTRSGKEVFQTPISERQKKFIQLILSHSVFNKSLNLYFSKGSRPKKVEIMDLMKKSNLFKVQRESTFRRRSSTILRWIDWILNQIEE